MAIAYSSQGAGVSTETSGAALSPLCPATVNAGDILIAHVFWEGTTTAPSTPSGWSPLSGPHVIESTVARHWVFGKIADGSEDGAAVAFGAPAVTTQRAARIYSFTGRVSGAIEELVTGFTHLSHATDPQMPTVTTRTAGALAVALVAQNDNNAMASATGETGGDWTEAVAEYTVALTPGFTLQIQTCTPTSNPGTVTGGTVATTDDPCGVIGFQIQDAPFPFVTIEEFWAMRQRAIGRQYWVESNIIVRQPVAVNAPRTPMISPRRPMAARAEWQIPNLLAGILTAAPAPMPFQSTDFRIRHTVKRQPDHSFGARLPEMPASMPFAGVECGARPMLADRRKGELVFRPQIPEPAVTTPFVSVDWLPRPMGRARLATELPNLMASTLAAPVTPTMVRSPLLHRRSPVSRPQDFTAPNLLLSVLGEPPAQMPYNVVEWSLRPRLGVRGDLASPNLLPSLLQFVAGTPFALLDWAVPRATFRKIDVPEQSGLALRTAIAASAPFVSIDWQPRSRLRVRHPVIIVRDLQEEAVATPFMLHDWPRPPRSAVREDFVQQNLIGFMTYNYGTPFTLHEWSAKPRAHARKDFAPQNILDLLTAVIQQPFFVTDWPVKQNLLLRKDVPAPNLLALLTAVPVVPFIQLDWSYPAFRALRNAGWADNVLPSLLQALAATPFVQSDWAAPRFRSHTKPEWAANLLPDLLQFIAGKPFVQTEWTGRDRAIPRLREQCFDDNLDLALLYSHAVNFIKIVNVRGLMPRLSILSGRMPGGTNVTGSKSGLTDIEGKD